MMTNVFKRALMALLFTTLAATACQAEPITDDQITDVEFGAVNVKELTNAQIFKYGRELYRKGDYEPAVKVFQRMLKGDCSNRVAQYHLQKIAEKSSKFSYLLDYLKELPCEKYNFSEEDFLPASLYYETDNDLLLAQLIAYNKRFHDNKESLVAQIAKYTTASQDMEKRVDELTKALINTAGNNAKIIEELQKNLSEAQQKALSMETQVSELKATLEQEQTKAALEQAQAQASLKQAQAQASLEQAQAKAALEQAQAKTILDQTLPQTTVEDPQGIDIAIHKDIVISDLKEQLAISKANDPEPSSPMPAKITKATIARVTALPTASTPAEATPAETIVSKTEASDTRSASSINYEKLADLQTKFARIQARLKEIEQTIIEKNQLIQDIETNSGATSK